MTPGHLVVDSRVLSGFVAGQHGGVFNRFIDRVDIVGKNGNYFEQFRRSGIPRVNPN